MDSLIQIGVIGAGTMGRGIAQIAATAGHPVTLMDTKADALDQAMSSLAKVFARLVEKGRVQPADAETILGRIQCSTDLNALSGAGLVVEAIVEKMSVKGQLFNELEGIVPPDCILATNTSSLSVTALASTLTQPERCLGLHFFNPAPLLPLVEVIPALQTRKGLAEEMVLLMRNWGKQPALAQDTPGFIVNRVARPFYGEAIRLWKKAWPMWPPSTGP